MSKRYVSFKVKINESIPGLALDSHTSNMSHPPRPWGRGPCVGRPRKEKDERMPETPSVPRAAPSSQGRQRPLREPGPREGHPIQSPALKVCEAPTQPRPLPTPRAGLVRESRGLWKFYKPHRGGGDDWGAWPRPCPPLACPPSPHRLSSAPQPPAFWAAAP